MALSFPIRLYKPSAAQRVAVLSVQPSTKHPGQLLLQVAKGASRDKLSDVQLLGPFTPEALDGAAQGVLDALVAQGYSATGAGRAIKALDEAKPRARALAALSVAWRGEQGAVPKLIEVAQRGKQDVSTAVDALGLLRAKAGLDVVKAEAERKLLSRRRAGAEALRNIGDADAVSQVRTRALERFEAPFLKVLLAQNEAEATPAGIEALVAAFDALSTSDRGLALDTLYELGTPLAVVTTRTLLERFAKQPAEHKRLASPHLWRYVKSVWKRSMLRMDFETWAPLTISIERLGRSFKGQKATLKSGLDGESREMRVFSAGTTRYIRGRAWRFLKRLATYQPAKFVEAATEVLCAYSDADDGIPRADVGSTGRLYLLHRVLYGASTRFTINWRTLNHHFKNKKVTSAPGGIREEAFGELWDSNSAAYVRLLGRATRTDVLRFALEAVRGRAKQALTLAGHGDLVALLDSTNAEVVGLALEELVRRFNPEAPDWALLEQLGKHPAERARSLATQWIARVMPLALKDEALTVRLLTKLNAQVSIALVLAVVSGLSSLDAGRRSSLAKALVAFVNAPEPSDSAHVASVMLLRDALVKEASAIIGMQGALGLLMSTSASAAELGATILGQLPGVLETLGWTRIAAMTRDEKAAVRRAALAIVSAHGVSLAANPGMLFELVESDWDDVRATALAVLGQFSFEQLTFDGLVALLDSPRVDVQTQALAMLERSFEAVDTQLLLSRLAQHPHPNMRKHVLGLVEKHLKPGFVQLSKIEGLLRAVLFDAVRPSRDLKQRTVAFLEQRGAQDAQQAEVATKLLGDIVRTQTKTDRERVLQALVRLQLAFPETKTLPGLRVGGAA